MRPLGPESRDPSVEGCHCRRRRVLEIEPSPELQHLERAILRQDARLDATQAVDAPAAKQRRRLLLSAAALTVAGGAAAAGLLVATGGTESPHAGPLPKPDSVVLLSVRSGKAIGQALARGVVASRFGAGSLWSLSTTGELTRIDPSSGRVRGTLNTSVSVPCGLAVGQGSVWVTDCDSPTLVQIDPSLDPPVIANRFRLPVRPGFLSSETHEVALGAGSVWVGQGNANPSYVHRLDPRTGRVQKSILIPDGGAQALAFGDGALWVANADISQVSRIDAGTNEVTATPSVGNTNICCLAAGGGYAWVATNPDHQIWKLDAQGAVTTSIKLAGVIENVTYSGSALWAAEGDAGAIVRIDPTTDEQRVYRVGHHLAGVAAGNGVVAVGVQQSAQDVTAGLKGRVIHLALKDDYLDWSSPDPAATQTAFNPYQVQFQYATCAKLYNYRDASGAAGRQLVPEVAAGWPRVSQEGHTYTFRIRRGYRFSPPSNAPVTAASFAWEIERVLSPRLQPGPWKLALLPDVVGAIAYHAGKSTRVSGVTVHGDLLVIRLVKPASDLPARPADPDFCAVPVRTPIVLNGIASPIPSAGPYYLAAHGGDAFVLKRNPNYSGPRPQRVDAIVYRTGVDVRRAVALVARGTVDYVAENDAALETGAAATAATSGRYRLTANNWTEGLAKLTGLSSRTLGHVARSPTPSTGIRSSPASPAATSFCRRALCCHRAPQAQAPALEYPLGGDLTVARRLMARRHVRAVLATYADATGAVFDPLVRTRAAGAFGCDRHFCDRCSRAPNAWPGEQSALYAAAPIARVEANASQTRDPKYLRSFPYLRVSDRMDLRRIAGLPSPRREAVAAPIAARLERDAIVIGVGDRATPELCLSSARMFGRATQVPGS